VDFEGLEPSSSPHCGGLLSPVRPRVAPS